MNRQMLASIGVLGTTVLSVAVCAYAQGADSPRLATPTETINYVKSEVATYYSLHDHVVAKARADAATWERGVCGLTDEAFTFKPTVVTLELAPRAVESQMISGGIGGDEIPVKMSGEISETKTEGTSLKLNLTLNEDRAKLDVLKANSPEAKQLHAVVLEQPELAAAMLNVLASLATVNATPPCFDPKASEKVAAPAFGFDFIFEEKEEGEAGFNFLFIKFGGTDGETRRRQTKLSFSFDVTPPKDVQTFLSDGRTAFIPSSSGGSGALFRRIDESDLQDLDGLEMSQIQRNLDLLSDPTLQDQLDMLRDPVVRDQLDMLRDPALRDQLNQVREFTPEQLDRASEFLRETEGLGQ